MYFEAITTLIVLGLGVIGALIARQSTAANVDAARRRGLLVTYLLCAGIIVALFAAGMYCWGKQGVACEDLPQLKADKESLTNTVETQKSNITTLNSQLADAQAKATEAGGKVTTLEAANTDLKEQVAGSVSHVNGLRVEYNKLKAKFTDANDALEVLKKRLDPEFKGVPYDKELVVSGVPQIKKVDVPSADPLYKVDLLAILTLKRKIPKTTDPSGSPGNVPLSYHEYEIVSNTQLELVIPDLSKSKADFWVRRLAGGTKIQVNRPYGWDPVYPSFGGVYNPIFVHNGKIWIFKPEKYLGFTSSADLDELKKNNDKFQRAGTRAITKDFN
jgi:hypothetical protein